MWFFIARRVLYAVPILLGVSFVVFLLMKMVPALAAVYLISPIDAVPDFFPVVGQLDDLGVILLALETFLKLCPANVVDFHRSAMARGSAYSPMPGDGEIIDAEFSRENRGR